MKQKTKDRIGNYAGLVFAVSTAIAGIGQGTTLPYHMTTICIFSAAVSGSIIGWLTGKSVK